MILATAAGCAKPSPPPPVMSQDEIPVADVPLAAGPQHASPFKNTAPDSAFAAESRCADCHAEIAAAYREHPMGRSLARVRDATPLERFDSAANLPLSKPGFEYDARLTADGLLQREHRLNAAGEKTLTIERTANYAVGSGQRGRSYLICDGDRLYMSPLTWYPQRSAWDFSPGYERNNSHFTRPIVAACLFCHAGAVNYDPQSLNRYPEPIFTVESIGCQRCHGPGEEHVKKHQAVISGESATGQEPDYSIVNPAHLAADLALDVCAQCHLGGAARVLAPGRSQFDFRPGLPLSDFIAIYTKPETSAKFVSHVEQMKQSRCYLGGDGELRCTSCHDPHRSPPAEGRAAYYRDRCLRCHQDQGCSAPEADRAVTSPADNCIACHMPSRITEIQHAAISDHRVPRDSAAALKSPPRSPADSSLVLFDTSALRRPGFPRERNLGLALRMAIELEEHPPTKTELATAVQLLENAVQTNPRDAVARESLGGLYLRQGKWSDAWEHFALLLRDEPDREYALVGAGRAALQSGKYREAADYWGRAVELNPSLPLYRSEYALALARLKDWPRCIEVSRAAVQKFPDHFAARQILVDSLLGSGDETAARAAFAELLQLEPPHEASLRRWFKEHPLLSKP